MKRAVFIALACLLPIAFALNPAPPVARADTCFNGQIFYTCYPADGPAPLLNTNTLTANNDLYTATSTQITSLQNLEQQAVNNTLTDHGLPSSDATAVQTWGRDDALAELWALIQQAITLPATCATGQTPGKDCRDTDQQNAVDWLTTVDQRQAGLAAENAGLEYLNWAGYGSSAYLADVAKYRSDLSAGNDTSADITNMKADLGVGFNPGPINYSGVVSTCPATGACVNYNGTNYTRGYCVYEPPQPFGSSDYSDVNNITCSSTCPESAICTPGGPSYDQLVKWGAADVNNQLYDTPGLAQEVNNAAIGAGFGIGSFALITALSLTPALLTPAMLGGTAAYSTSLALFPFATAGLAGVAVGGLLLIALAGAIAIAFYAVQVYDSAAVPGQLVDLLTAAATTRPDLSTLVGNATELSGLFSLFIGATLPAPAGGNGNNSLDPNSFLNPPALPQPTATDPEFKVQQNLGTAGSPALGDPTYSTTIAWKDTADNTTHTDWLHRNWFIDEASGTSGTSTRQTLRIKYTDWNGNEQTAWLLNLPGVGYRFVGIQNQSSSGTPPNYSTCLTDGTCSASTAIHYVGTDGKDYSAEIATTSTALSSSRNPSIPGATVTYRATVSPVPSGGTVAFLENGTDIGCGDVQVDTTTGTATCGVAYSVVGDHTITATFGGSGHLPGSTSDPLKQTVAQISTTTTLSSFPNPSVAGQQVTFAVQLNPAPDGGNVEFFNAKTGIDLAGCSAVAVNSSGQARCTVTFTTSGDRVIEADYLGDTGYAFSSDLVTQTVNPAVAPGAPSITSPATGTWTHGGTTANPLAISGTAAAGSTVKLYDVSSLNPCPTSATSLSSLTPVDTETANSTTGAWASSLSDVSEGTHVFAATASNTGGSSAPSGCIVVKVDRTNPAVSITIHPTNPTNDTSAAFTFSANDNGDPVAGDTLSYQCKLATPGNSSPAFTNCTSSSSMTYTSSDLSADGQYTFTVQATDGAGNSAADHFTWTVDTAPPTISINAPSDGASLPLDGTATSFDFSCGDALDTVVSCTGSLSGTVIPVPIPVNTSDPIPAGMAGTFTLTIGAMDQAGNVSQKQVNYTVTNPLPAISSLSQLSAVAGSSGFTLKVFGSNFVTNLSQVKWNGTTLGGATYKGSGDLVGEIDVPVPSSDLASAGTVYITVATPGPGGGTSNPRVLYVTPAGTTVSGTDVATSTNSGGTATASVGGTGAGTGGNVTAVASGQGTIAVAQFSNNPETGAPPTPVNAYFDVNAAPGSNFSAVSITDCNLAGGSVLYYWTGSNWSALPGQNYSAGPPACVTATITDTSILAGTPLGVSDAPPQLTLPTSPTVQYSAPANVPISATDVEGDDVTLSASGLPGGLSLGSTTCTGGVCSATVSGTDTAAAGGNASACQTAGGTVSGTSCQYTATITATEQDSGAGNPKTNRQLTITVSQAATTTSLSSSANPSVIGQSITLKASVASNAPATATPIGSVTFKDGATTLGTVQLTNGTASLTTSSLGVGSHSLTALYSGSGNFSSGPAASLTQLVRYGTKLLYKPSLSGTVGSSIPIKVELMNYAGTNLSSSTLPVQALCVVVQGAKDCSSAPAAFNWTSGSPQYFTFLSTLASGGGYQFNLKSTGLVTGRTYQLLFKVQGEDSGSYHVDAAATFTLTK